MSTQTVTLTQQSASLPTQGAVPATDPSATNAPAPTPDSHHPAKTQQDSEGFNFPKPAKYASKEEERQARKERLALAFRVFGMLGFDEGVAGHLTYRDPILTDHFWVNPCVLKRLPGGGKEAYLIAC